ERGRDLYAASAGERRHLRAQRVREAVAVGLGHGVAAAAAGENDEVARLDVRRRDTGPASGAVVWRLPPQPRRRANSRKNERRGGGGQPASTGGRRRVDGVWTAGCPLELARKIGGVLPPLVRILGERRGHDALDRRRRVRPQRRDRR